MSERERWIVYPLLFFALGAAVRDKILHRVDSKEIYCESLKIIDQQDPTGRAFVELSIKRARPNDPTQLADRVGLLRMVNSNGKEVCEVASGAFFGQLNANQMIVRDDDMRPLVVAGYEQGPGMPLPNGEPTVNTQGVIYVNNQKLRGGIKIAPPINRRLAPKQPPAQTP